MAQADTSLQDRLDEITAATRRLVGAERLQVSEQAIEALFASGVEERILKPGARAPEFDLENANGKRIRLADMLAFGPVVVKFFRGRWCPYCVTELEAWRDLYDTLRARGTFLVAIGPQTVRQNDFMVDQHRLPFPVLADPGCRVVDAYGAMWTVPEPMRGYYRSILVNIPFINGDESWRLPLPATFVVARDGQIAYSEAHADFRVRPEPEEALTAIGRC